LRKVDCHVHIYPPQVIRDWERIAETEPYFGQLARGKVHRWATAEDALAAMDEAGISESWAFGFAFRDLGLCRECNDAVIDFQARHPGRVKGFAVVPPLARGAEEEILRCREKGLWGVGELFPEGQGFDLSDIRQTWRLAGTCHEAGLPVVLHTAEPVGHDYPGKGTVGPKEAAIFCANHPELKVVFAHMGGGLWLYELMPGMSTALQNAWYDTAALPFLYGPAVLKAAWAAGVGNKILFGSDFPILKWPRYDSHIQASGLAEEQVEDLLGGNASRFFANRTS
jgi:predicted TIM-barrel fold metal-dependent hydrolase